jgi:diguanylate cyclase (GGDEF)-like protein
VKTPGSLTLSAETLDPISEVARDPANQDAATVEDFTSKNSRALLGLVLGLLAAFAGIYAALYVASRVRPGLSLHLQRRALSFLVLAGLLFALAQLLYALGAMVSPNQPDTYLVLGQFAAGTALAGCLIVVGSLLRRSELDEVGPLRRSADLDPLTALYNQPFFRRAASRRLAQAKRYGVPLSLAMLDVDNFKAYNDFFGHEAGNAALRCVAGVLRRSARADDLVARYGGEEFVMLLNSEPREAEEALERIRSQIAGRCSPGGDLLPQQVTVSIGVATLSDHTPTLERLIKAADEAIYNAKKAGKNRVVGSEEVA